MNQTYYITGNKKTCYREWENIYEKNLTKIKRIVIV